MNPSSAVEAPAFELRPYQRATIAGVIEAGAHGAGRIVVVAPSGAGKSALRTLSKRPDIAVGPGARFVAHRRELA
jgi:superfamily II DNA or RNA helicase